MGTVIAERLSSEKHDVTVIDTNPEKINDITGRLDVMGIVGNGASYKLLKEAEIDDSDIFIACTGQDEINLLSCLFARQAGKCSTMARVRNPGYRDEISYIKEELGLSLILNPDYDAAMEVARVLRFPTAIKIDTFAKGRAELIRVALNENSFFVNKSIIEIAKSTGMPALVAIVERDDDVIIPDGNFVFKKGDTINVLSTPRNARDFFRKIGHDTHQIKNAIIVGAGRMTYYLAKQLLNTGIAVKVVDTDRAKCDEISEQLSEATVICADATDEDIMREEGVETVGGFVSLTGMDEANIFLSLYAQKVSKAKIVTKINHLAINDIVKNFSLGSIITPQNISADMVLSYVRARQNSVGSNVETLYRLMDNRVEALEFKISEGAPVIGKPLSELNNLLIGCVFNDSDGVVIANGNTVIKPGDTVVVITTDRGLNDIKDIIR